MKTFHRGGVVKGPKKHGRLAGEGPAILSPSGRMVSAPLFKKHENPETATYSVNVQVTMAPRENLRRFIGEAWSDMMTAIDEEGCGAFMAEYWNMCRSEPL